MSKYWLLKMASGRHLITVFKSNRDVTCKNTDIFRQYSRVICSLLYDILYPVQCLLVTGFFIVVKHFNKLIAVIIIIISLSL